MFSTRKRCLIGIPIRGYQNFYSLPPKNWILGPKTAKFGQKWHFWPNIGIYGPFGPMPVQRTMRTRCLGGFPVVWVSKVLLPPVKVRMFDPKKAKFCPKKALLVIFGQILAYFAHLVQCPTNKSMRAKCISGFLICLYQNLAHLGLAG